MKIFRIESLAVTFFIVLVILSIFHSGYFVVRPGEVAVKIRLGKIIDSYDEGFYFKLPFIEKSELFSIRINRTDIKTDAFSRDLQSIDVDLVVNHRIEKDTVKSIYRNLGPNYEHTVVDPIVQEEIKAVFARYSAESVVSNRSDVANEISEIIKKRLLEKQIIITDISVTNFDFTKEFLTSVEEKQIAEQRAQKALKDVERVKAEAQQTIEQAKAEAKSLEMQRAAVSPTLIELRKVEAQIKAIEKWDGKLPHYNGGAVPFLQIDGK